MDTKKIALEFGERLRSERARLKYSQEQLASAMGVKKLTILNYEKGSTQPNLNAIYKLQDLGFNAQFLVFGGQTAYQMNRLSPETLEMITRLVADIENNFGGGSFTDLARFRLYLVLLDKYLKAAIPLRMTDSKGTELSIGSHHVET